MPSTYNPLLRLELQATGENATTWGIKTNTNLNLLADSIAGATTINVAGSGDYTLSTANGADDESRHSILLLTGLLTGNRNVIVPTSSKNYVVRNSTTGSFTLTVKTAAGTGIVIPTGYVATIFCDGTNVVAATSSFNATTNTVSANVVGNLTGAASSNVLKAGDTMTGDLTITKISPLITLNKTASSQNAIFASQTAGSFRWVVVAGDSSAESGSNAGSNFGINRYDDAGSYIDTPLSIIRSTGVVNFSIIPEGPASNPTTNNQLARKAYVDTKAASGAITASGLTQATSRLLGRTTSGTGAVEEISVGAGLALSAGSLALTSGDLQFNSGYGSVATAYGCRAWVNFNGTGTVAIRASGNVSSITDSGVGTYRVNFTTALVDANYSCVAMASSDDATTMTAGIQGTAAAVSTTGVSICAWTGGGFAADRQVVTFAAFR